MIKELCYWCDTPYVDGKPNCSHPEIEAGVEQAGEILAGIEFCDHFCCGMAPKVCHAKQLAAILEKLLKDEREACHQAARGSNDPNAFNKFGNRQLYWKGRSDAATAIRARNKSPETRMNHCQDNSSTKIKHASPTT